MNALNTPTPRTVFVTGGTGYIGAPLIHALIERGHRVRALVRAESRRRALQLLPAACDIVNGDALDPASISAALSGADTFVQLVGVSRPSPRKAPAFRAIDLKSALAGLVAATDRGTAHFVYLSVTQFADGKAPAMRAYVAARAEAEARITTMVGLGKLSATLLRPWYVLGPGHRWPLLLLPLYWLAGRVPVLRGRIEGMGLVWREQMIAALVHAIENPPPSVRVVGVSQIRQLGGFSRRLAPSARSNPA